MLSSAHTAVLLIVRPPVSLSLSLLLYTVTCTGLLAVLHIVLCKCVCVVVCSPCSSPEASPKFPSCLFELQGQLHDATWHLEPSCVQGHHGVSSGARTISVLTQNSATGYVNGAADGWHRQDGSARPSLCFVIITSAQADCKPSMQQYSQHRLSRPALLCGLIGCFPAAN